MKKSLSIILVLLMALSLFAGCAKTENQGAATEKGLIELNYTLEDRDASFFMDREYAVDAESAETTEAELKKAEEYLTNYILEAAENGDSAFDFQYGDTTFAATIKEWTLATEQTGDDETKTDWTLTYTKADLPITVTVYATLYKEYAIIEWTVWITNTGNEKSQQITEFYGLNDVFAQSTPDSEFRITTFEGGHESHESFKAAVKTLEKGAKKITNGTGGKSSVTWSPYMNLQWNNPEASWGKEGVFVSTGWSGQWVAKAENTGEGLSVTAKQERLDTYLNPGEAIRSPLMTLLFWERDFMRSQNLWRRWVYNVAMPQPNGEPIQTHVHGNTAQDTNLTQTATTDNQVEAIQKWVEWGLDIDAWQMDAGWYDMANNSGNWVDTGDWEPSKERFNGSLKTIADELDKNDIDFILWYEPERMVTNSVWQQKFKGTGYIIEASGWQCYNLANDEATDWLIDFMKDSIDRNGVDIYRQDCNLNDAASLMSYWKELEEDGRKGYSENRYIINYLRYFDAIVEHTGTYIDNCASGGKRLDLESTKRAVALWRDDKCYEATLTQCQSWGINFFMPYSGQGSLDQSPGTMLYTFRSNMMTYTGLPWKLGLINDSSIDLHKQVIEEHKTYAHYLTQDYYPLTPFTQEEDTWMAWQYNDASDSTGIIQVFKRMASKEDSAVYYLNGLQPETTYRVEDIDTGDFVELTGKQLMQDGVQINVQTEFDAKIYKYAPVTTEAE